MLTSLRATRNAVLKILITLAVWSVSMSASPATIEVIAFAGGFNWPIWTAQDRGFFAQNGMDVHLTFTPGSEYQLKNLIEGKFDIAMTAIDNVIAYEEGQGEASVNVVPNLAAVMGGDNGFLRLVTVPEVTTYSAIKGKTLTVDALTTGYAFVLRKMLQRAGLREDEYELVKIGGVLARFDDLMQKKHAGTLLLTPFEITAQAKGFRVIDSAVDAFGGHYQGLVAATRRDWASKHASELVGYIRGYVAGLTWLYDPQNREEAITLLRDHLPQMSPELAAKSYDILLDPTQGFSRKAAIDFEGVRQVLALRSEYGEPKRLLGDPMKYLDLTYYSRAFAH
jgi:ABC-type nitrate/sulfonate/bicarbonate transport system substrate-binding protein